MKVAVLGVGLIGGSIGLAARRRAGARVAGYDPDASVLEEALATGAIDEPAPTLADAVSGADVVFVATPVGALAQTVREALDHAGPGCLLSDVGSTKREVVEAVVDPRFIGGHPLAGAETAGVEHAREDLFDGAVWYLTPRPDAPGAAVERLCGLIEQLGARPTTIDAEAHDRLMACVSHLPHVLANVLVAQAVRALGEGDRALDASSLGAGPSFRDATRVAGANTAIWTDIYLSNRDALVEAIDEALRALADVRTALATADADALASWNERAREDREKLTKREAFGAGAGLAPGS